MLTKPLIASILAGMTLISATIQDRASAQPLTGAVYDQPGRSVHRSEGDGSIALSGRDLLRPGCVRACANDSNPCDPVSYKQSDGRCSGD